MMFDTTCFTSGPFAVFLYRDPTTEFLPFPDGISVMYMPHDGIWPIMHTLTPPVWSE